MTPLAKAVLQVTTLLCSATLAFAAATPAQKCLAGKHKLAGAHAACLHKAEATFATKGDVAKYSAALAKCATKFGAAWAKLETKAAGVCPSDGDVDLIRDAIGAHVDNIAGALAGGSLQACPTGQGARLTTGQTQCYDAAGTAISCTATGQDGELQRGLGHFYLDNGDGTITDVQTGLMWEKQSDDGSVHDQDNLYDWTEAFAAVAALNAASFAGHTDWRLPNINELQSLVNYGAVHPSTFTPFHTGCVGGCTVLTCSCTQSTFEYWSSTTYQNLRTAAMYVDFNVAIASFFTKTGDGHVRAVRDAQ